MRWYTNILSCLSLTLASPLIEERNNGGGAADGILNDSYPTIAFGQSRANINDYTKKSIQSLVLAVNHTDGQFLDGIPNLVGRFFFWQSCNGWTGVSQYDLDQGKDYFFHDVFSAHNALARYPGGSFETYGVPLVNDYNDDAGCEYLEGWVSLMLTEKGLVFFRW